MHRCWFAFALLALSPAALRAQGGQAARPPHVIRWYEAGGAVAAIAALTLLDEPVQRLAQRNRTVATDEIAALFRHGGQPEVYVTVSLGILATGIIAQRPAITRVGARAATSVALAALTELSLKPLIGRARPFSGVGAFRFKPFSGSFSMPSGHTTVAFALAASLADDVRSPLLRSGLYAVALGTGLSRINDDKHWLSDVVAGALIGITAAKLVNGRWQVFGLRPPRGLVATQTVVGWHVTF